LDGHEGFEPLSVLRGVERKGHITFYHKSQAKLATHRTCVLYPDSGVIQIIGDSFQISEVIKNGQAYLCNSSFDNCHSAPSEKTSELRRTAREANRELVFELERWQFEGEVHEEVDHFRVRVTDSEIGPITYWFDKKSHLLVKKQREKRVRTYGDWRKVDAFLFPYLIEDSEDGRRLDKLQLAEVLVLKQSDFNSCISILESMKS
jgi:hypothetical protein